MHVSIIGTGHCGCAFTADLMHRGHKVALWADPKHRTNFDMIKRKGHLDSKGVVEGRFRPAIKNSLSAAVHFSKTLIITVPSDGHDAILERLGKYDLSKHIVIAISGNLFSLRARRLINAKAIIDTATSPYGCRVVAAEETVYVKSTKRVLPVAALSTVSRRVRDVVADIFPQPLDWRSNALELFFMGVGAIIHVPTAIHNADKIIGQVDFHFYKDGMNAEVCETIRAIDEERTAIATAFGLKSEPVLALMNRYYGTAFPDFQAFAKGTIPHNATKGNPPNMQHRYITQDVPFVLVLLYKLGLAVGFASPRIKLLIDQASAINVEDYMMTGRSLEELGLHGSRDEILRRFDAVISPSIAPFSNALIKFRVRVHLDMLHSQSFRLR